MSSPGRLIRNVSTLSYMSNVFKDLSGMDACQHDARFAHWWAWAEQNAINAIEYLLPQIQIPTDIRPFTFERRFVEECRREPPASDLEALGPWAYQIEFGNTSTLGVRHEADWTYHRYRANSLVGTAARIAGIRIGGLSVLDVASHCGIQSLELAERGFRNVLGIDLRPENIKQAHYLRRTFDVQNVFFEQANVWNLDSFEPRDVVFCCGLLYHVTYPLKLLKMLYDLTSEFIILDTLVHKHPFSGFHLVCNKNVEYSAEGEFSYELHPTYRAVCDGLQAVGFTQIYEIVGEDSRRVPNYRTGNVRSFVAARDDSALLSDFVASLDTLSDAPRCRPH
jgi:SAM-dependent methyltransferase